MRPKTPPPWTARCGDPCTAPEPIRMVDVAPAVRASTTADVPATPGFRWCSANQYACTRTVQCSTRSTLFRSASAAVDPVLIGTRSRTAGGVPLMRLSRCSARWRVRSAAAPGPGRIAMWSPRYSVRNYPAFLQQRDHGVGEPVQALPGDVRDQDGPALARPARGGSFPGHRGRGTDEVCRPVTSMTTSRRDRFRSAARARHWAATASGPGTSGRSPGRGRSCSPPAVGRHRAAGRRGRSRTGPGPTTVPRT